MSDVWQRFDVTLSVASSHSGLRTKFVMLTPASVDRGNYALDSASLVESSPNPVGLLELVAAGSPTVRVKGYAIDPNQPYDAVPILVSVGAEQTPLAAYVVRPDVGALYPSAGPVHGFEAQIATAQSGPTQVCVVARNLGVGADTALGCVTIVIAGVTTTFAPTAVAPTTTAAPTTAPSPLGPQAFEPNRLVSLFDADNVAAMTTAYDFEVGDADTLRLYWAFFDREADVVGAKYWIGLGRAGMTLDAMAFNFAQSVEFQRTYGSVSDHEFLDIVYRNVLGRRYDSTGFEYWLAVIHAGLARSGTVRWIAANAEFVKAHPYP